MKIVGLILGFFALALLGADAKPKIIWHINDWPPYYFPNGDMKGEGEAGAAVYKAIELLPEYEHEVNITPTKRAYALLKKQGNHCRGGMFKNPKREEFIHYAKHNQYYFPYGVTVYRKYEMLFKPYVDEKGYIDLDAALKSGKITLAITHGQSYGKKIDETLKKYQDTIKFKSFGAKMRSELIKQLYKDYGFHATLAIPEEINYNVKQEKLDGNQLLYYPVKGTELFEPGYWGYIGCSKSAFGEKVIGKINQNITAIRAVSVEKYRNFLDENAKKLHHEAEEIIFQ